MYRQPFWDDEDVATGTRAGMAGVMHKPRRRQEKRLLLDDYQNTGSVTTGTRGRCSRSSRTGADSRAKRAIDLPAAIRSAPGYSCGARVLDGVLQETATPYATDKLSRPSEKPCAHPSPPDTVELSASRRVTDVWDARETVNLRHEEKTGHPKSFAPPPLPASLMLLGDMVLDEIRAAAHSSYPRNGREHYPHDDRDPNHPRAHRTTTCGDKRKSYDKARCDNAPLQVEPAVPLA
ncbi:hypothetical protein B0H11DRAFT_2237505 [Mycena galericulata]|nr:hypothetical protein B0H11DRAFT_2237505 [Mycena galericulata]